MNCKARGSEKNQQKSEGPRDVMIHDKWAQSGHFGGRSQSDQKYIDRNWPMGPIRPVRSLRIVFGESPRNAMATTWGFWDHPSRLCSQDSWAWWGDLASQASNRCQCMHRLYMAIPDYPISRDDCSEQNSDFQWKKWFGNMMLEEKFLEVEGFPRSDMWTLVTCSLRTYSG